MLFARIPVPGGPGGLGILSFANTGFTPIVHGNSYVQLVPRGEGGAPDASGILTYSQSPRRDSAHYADQREFYADGKWVDLPFTEEETLADPKLVLLTLFEWHKPTILQLRQGRALL